MTTDTPESVKASVAEINCLLTAHTTLVGAEWEGYGPPKSVREAHAALTRYAESLERENAHIRGLESALDEAMIAPPRHDQKTWMRETVDEYEELLVAKEQRIRARGEA